MQYIQTSLFYVLGTAAMAGMFCLIIMNSSSIFSEIFRIMLTGTLAFILIPILLRYILSGAAIVITWRLIKNMMASTKRTTETIRDAIERNPHYSNIKEEYRNKRLRRIRQKRRIEKLKRETELTARMLDMDTQR